MCHRDTFLESETRLFNSQHRLEPNDGVPIPSGGGNTEARLCHCCKLHSTNSVWGEQAKYFADEMKFLGRCFDVLERR